MTQSAKVILPRCKCPGCSLWLRLEAERLDTSYKTGGRKVEPAEVKTKTKIVYRERNNDDRDRLYFNAGRYSAGARDSSATRAFEELQKEEESTNDR